jgi:pyruvate formate lyase activating enzyme
MHDTAQLARKRDIHGVVVSNGFINAEPLKALAEHISAYKVDLKSYRDKYYQEICDGRLQPVLDTLVRLKKLGIWSEIVYLVLPTLNDSDEEIKDLCQWIRDNLGPNVPLHFSRFHPTYKITHLPPTPVSTLERLHQIARDHKLNYVYVGNVPGHKYNSTFCPQCGELLIKRRGYFTTLKNFKNGACSKCGNKIAGVWE